MSFFAGDDLKNQVGPYRNYYGNYVVLQHEIPGFDEPVYTLYAHLSEIDVEEGDEVKAGDQIGLVGRLALPQAPTCTSRCVTVRTNSSRRSIPSCGCSRCREMMAQLRGAIAGRILSPAGNLCHTQYRHRAPDRSGSSCSEYLLHQYLRRGASW